MLTLFEIRKDFILKTLLNKNVIVRKLGVRRPEEDTNVVVYVPLPEYGIALWYYEEHKDY